MGTTTKLLPTSGRYKYDPRKDTKKWAPYKLPNAQGKGHCYPTTRPGARGIPIPLMQRGKQLFKSYGVDLKLTHMQKLDLKVRHQKVVQYRIPTAEAGMPMTSKYGNSSTRKPGSIEALTALADFNHTNSQIPPEELRIFLDGSEGESVKGHTGAGAKWTSNNGDSTGYRSWPVSTKGTSALGEYCAYKNSLQDLLTFDLRDQKVHFFIDCQSVVQMFTGWSQPTEHVDIVDTCRQYMHKLQTERNIAITIHWIPSHVGIPGNDDADTEAKRGAVEAGEDLRNCPHPDYNAREGISYRSAKTQIAVAVKRATEEQWSKTVTTLSNYKTTLQPTLYLEVGTPQQIRFRTQLMLGCDVLNFTRQRFGRGVADPYCPRCPTKHETVDHFLCKCKMYTEPRRALYKAFVKVYPNRQRIFNHIGLMREPESKHEIAAHIPIITALNVYITEAYRMRTEYYEYEQAFNS